MKAVRLHQQHSTPVVETFLPEASLAGPVVELAGFTQPRLELKLAVVLAAAVSPTALPGDVARAVTGVFLAVDILDGGEAADSPRRGGRGGFVLGEQLLPLDVAGALRLHVDGELVAEASVAGRDDPVTRIAWVATEINGLDAGDAVLLSSPAASVPATSGTLLLEGPRGAMLAAELRVAT